MAHSLRVATVDEMDVIVAIDDDATSLYRAAGIVIDLPPDHPFTVDERRRWTAAAERGRLVLAVDDLGEPAGFAALDWIDGAAYLDQLSVRRDRMRRGLGRALLRHAVAWADETGSAALWLTTYAHVAWNRPFYEREGFVVVPEPECGPELLRHLLAQHEALPFPEHRVAMRRTPEHRVAMRRTP
ncbi:MAG TPA: GNAT family N-acetyltransferase [Polyangiaceae bacterium]|nr:GNAT family N-acetyltransferase [Polyangiaceae bacterium]